MKTRLMIYIFIVMLFFNWLLGLNQAAELNNKQAIIEARLSEEYVLDHSLAIKILRNQYVRKDSF